MSALMDNQYLAVIDTETNLLNKVMSIGVVIAQKDTYHVVAEKYYIITPETIFFWICVKLLYTIYQM